MNVSSKLQEQKVFDFQDLYDWRQDTPFWNGRKQQAPSPPGKKEPAPARPPWATNTVLVANATSSKDGGGLMTPDPGPPDWVPPSPGPPPRWVPPPPEWTAGPNNGGGVPPPPAGGQIANVILKSNGGSGGHKVQCQTISVSKTSKTLTVRVYLCLSVMKSGYLR